MHVISASRRTDIPAFHSQWFMNRIRAGTVRVRSPFGGKIFDVPLNPEDVIAIVFWTKNAYPLMTHLKELETRGYCFSFLYTINNYPASLEPGVPDCGHTIKVVRSLREQFPSSIVRWRYDTIVLTDDFDEQWHLENFRVLCELLSPFTSECIFSFCDYYRKTVRNMDRCLPGYRRPDETQCLELAREMAEIASESGITLASCAHDFLVGRGIVKARCIDPEMLLSVVDSENRRNALAKLKRTPTRKDCGCAASRDIGAYDTCSHGCVYCYANADRERARQNMSLISPEDAGLDKSLKKWAERS